MHTATLLSQNWFIQYIVREILTHLKIPMLLMLIKGRIYGKKLFVLLFINVWCMSRFRMVKKWFPQNTFFSWFFTGGAFIMVYYIIKLVLEFQFDLQNPLKQPKKWIFEKWKIIVFSQNHGIFWPKGDLKPCTIMYLGNIHNMSLVPVTFRNFFFQILQKWHFLG